MSENVIKQSPKPNNWQIAQVSNIIGISFLAMFFFGEFVVRNGMIDWNNATQTFQNISSGTVKFELGILAFMIVLLLDIVVATAFYQLVKKQNQSLALLMTFFRIVHICIKGGGMVGLLMARNTVVNASKGEIIQHASATVLQYLEWHHIAFGIGLFFFGIHLILFAKLLFNTEWMAKWVAVLVFASGIGFSLNSLAQFFMEDVAWLVNGILLILILPMTFAELIVGLWLMAKRKKLKNQVVL